MAGIKKNQDGKAEGYKTPLHLRLSIPQKRWMLRVAALLAERKRRRLMQELTDEAQKLGLGY